MVSGREKEVKGEMERNMEQRTKKPKCSLAHQQKKGASGGPSAEKTDIYFSVKLFFALPYNEGRAIVRIFRSFKLI